jgi:hypothetical protein
MPPVQLYEMRSTRCRRILAPGKTHVRNERHHPFPVPCVQQVLTPCGSMRHASPHAKEHNHIRRRGSLLCSQQGHALVACIFHKPGE